MPQLQRTVVLADDHDLYRAGLRALVEGLPRARVVAEARSGAQVAPLVAEHQPNLLVLDYALPELSGLDALTHIDTGRTHVLILTASTSPAVLAEAMASAARGVVSKNDTPEEVERAIVALLGGREHYSDAIRSAIAEAHAAADLTQRELQVLRLIAQGKRNKAVADALGIAVKTVDSHRTNLMRKLDAHSVAELVDYALRVGLVE